MLMEKNNMTEQEAFRYIQKCSMDSGNTMVESATMVMSIFTDAITLKMGIKERYRCNRLVLLMKDTDI